MSGKRMKLLRRYARTCEPDGSTVCAIEHKNSNQKIYGGQERLYRRLKATAGRIFHFDEIEKEMRTR